jgi:putative transcriptional regulator
MHEITVFSDRYVKNMENKQNLGQPVDKGVLLISEPFLPDPNFERTVVLICDHNDQGSVGFVLNRYADIRLADVVDEFVDIESSLFLGGPVEQNTMHFLHKIPYELEGCLPLGEGVAWGGDFEKLKILVSSNQVNLDGVRFFLGYSGWAPGQLEKEIEENSWIVYKPDSLMEVWEMEVNDLWRKILKKMGGKFKMMSNYPIDPRLN